MLKDTLDDFGKYVVQQSRSNLSKQDKNVSKKLYNSISYETKVNKNSFELTINMVDYGKFIDKGVKGVNSSAKAPTSPFKYGSGTGKKGGLTSGINGWVRARRFQFKDRKSGKFMSYDSTAFLIRRSIWFTGIKTTNFLTTPFERAFKRLPEDIVEAYGLELDSLMETTIL